MWEAWELRPGDIDLSYCQSQRIPVYSTDESSQQLNTLAMVGDLAAFKLLEAGIRVRGGRIGVISSGKFQKSIVNSLSALNAGVASWGTVTAAVNALRSETSVLDAIVVGDHEALSWGAGEWSSLGRIASENEIPVLNISGAPVVLEAILGDLLLGGASTESRTMQCTLGDLGPHAVIDLHTAGLRIGSDCLDGLQQGLQGAGLDEFVFRSGLAETRII